MKSKSKQNSFISDDSNMLPPYMRWKAEPGDEIKVSYFKNLPEYQHHSSAVPLSVCRELYENNESSGTYQHVDFLALYVIRSGRGIHWINGHPYGVVPGDVYLMASGASHSFSQFTNLEIDVFYFQNSLFTPEELTALRQCPGIWQLFVGDKDVEPRVHASPEEWRHIEAQVEIIRSDWAENASVGGILLKSEFFRLLIFLARLLQTRNQVQPSSLEEKHQDMGLAEALRYCEEHSDKPLTVAHLASRSFLCRGHFSQVFTREVGMPPATYVRRVRLEKARALLRETKLSVAQIALQCGFPNAAQFSRTFRNFYKISPLQYRKKE